jgi:hypothetical protein
LREKVAAVAGVAARRVPELGNGLSDVLALCRLSPLYIFFGSRILAFNGVGEEQC